MLYEVKEQVLPGFPVRIAFDQDGCGEQRGGQDDAEDVAADAFRLVVVMMVMFVCHKPNCFLRCKDILSRVQLGCKCLWRHFFFVYLDRI